MIYLVCYDITDPLRLRRAAKTLERFGIRVQYSFFQVDAGVERMDELVRALKRHLNLKYDKLYIYPLCDDCRTRYEVQGSGSLLPLESFVIL